MRCRAGDVAVVVIDEDFPANLGTFVEVIQRANDIEGLPAWDVRPFTPVICWEYPGRESKTASIIELGEIVEWVDCELQPIRDPGDDATDEILKIVGKPHKEVA